MWVIRLLVLPISNSWWDVPMQIYLPSPLGTCEHDFLHVNAHPSHII